MRRKSSTSTSGWPFTQFQSKSFPFKRKLVGRVVADDLVKAEAKSSLYQIMGHRVGVSWRMPRLSADLVGNVHW